MDHTRTKTKSPQTNGICERFHKTMLNELYRVAYRKKLYRTLDEPGAGSAAEGSFCHATRHSVRYGNGASDQPPSQIIDRTGLFQSRPNGPTPARSLQEPAKEMLAFRELSWR